MHEDPQFIDFRCYYEDAFYFLRAGYFYHDPQFHPSSLKNRSTAMRNLNSSRIDPASRPTFQLVLEMTSDLLIALRSPLNELAEEHPSFFAFRPTVFYT